MKENIFKYLIEESEFKSDYIKLPNFLVSLWVSNGYPFHINYNIYTTKGIDMLVCWWLKNIKVTTSFNSMFIEYFMKYSKLTNSNVTILMEMIWSQRNDLKIAFKEPKGKDNQSFVSWWILNGFKEYNIPVYYLNEINDFIYFIDNVLWKYREDLQEAFPDYKNKDRSKYIQWLLSVGFKEYGISIDNLKNINLDYLINEIVWYAREDLQEAFPDYKNKDKSNYIQWWNEFGINEYCSSFSSNKECIDKNNISQIKNKESNKIALIGHPSGNLGLGEDARLIKESLELVGYEVHSYIANRYVKSSEEYKKDVYDLLEYENNEIYLCNIFCLPAFDMIGLFFEYGDILFDQTYNIGIWQWELVKFPKEAELAIKLVDKVLSISKYSSQSIKNTFPFQDVKTIPLPCKDPGFLNINNVRINNKFKFYFAFDRNSFIDRKNPLALIESFQRAFKNNYNVELILKVIGDIDSQIWNETIRKSLVDKRILIIDKSLTRNEYNNLLNGINCVVSLHRAEGFGRVLAEALLMEKPLISTAFSGNLDFMNSENSYLVKGEIIPVFEHDYLFAKNNQWFEPNIDHASELMLEVYNNYEEAKEKAKLGRKNLLENYSLEKTGRYLDVIIKEIKEN
jgi:hypothetical protein